MVCCQTLLQRLWACAESATTRSKTASPRPVATRSVACASTTISTTPSARANAPCALDPSRSTSTRPPTKRGGGGPGAPARLALGSRSLASSAASIWARSKAAQRWRRCTWRSTACSATTPLPSASCSASSRPCSTSSSTAYNRCGAVLPFLEPKHRLRHPGNYLFLVSKQTLPGSEVPEDILFIFQAS